MTRRVLLVAMICLALVGFVGVDGSTVGASSKNKGLFVTPVREYLHVAAGKKLESALTVANLTEKKADITLSVEQFTVEDYSYDYMFTPSKKDWIKLGVTQLALEPGKSKKVPYSLDVPQQASPGGYYFTIFAAETLDDGTGSRKVRVGEALYVTVDGELRKTSHIQDDTMPAISFGGDIPFRFDAKSTGNTHFFMYVSGTLHGLGTELKGQENTHILLPGTIRTVKGAIPSPLWPGIYEATYGYRVDDGQIITQSKRLIYLPLWFLLSVAGLTLVMLTIWRRRRLAVRKAIDS